MQSYRRTQLLVIAFVLFVNGCSLNDPVHGLAVFRDSSAPAPAASANPISEPEPLPGTQEGSESNSDNLAIASLNEIIDARPDSFELYVARAFAYADEKDYPAAIADYTHAIHLKPDSARTYFARGKAYALEGKFALANADLAQGLKAADPRSRRTFQE